MDYMTVYSKDLSSVILMANLKATLMASSWVNLMDHLKVN